MAFGRFPVAVTTVLSLVGSQAVPAAGLTLPDPRIASGPSVSEALEGRRSMRQFHRGPISLRNAGQLLWAAQGRNRPERRTTPSAGGLYPLTAYLVAGAVADLRRVSRRFRGASPAHITRCASHTDRTPRLERGGARLVAPGEPEA